MNLFLSRLDEQQRRWYVALEAKKLGHGGATQMAQITGIHVETLRRGQKELDSELADRPADRVRLPGGGRPPVEKNARHRRSASIFGRKRNRWRSNERQEVGSK